MGNDENFVVLRFRGEIPWHSRRRFCSVGASSLYWLMSGNVWIFLSGESYEHLLEMLSEAIAGWLEVASQQEEIEPKKQIIDLSR